MLQIFYYIFPPVSTDQVVEGSVPCSQTTSEEVVGVIIGHGALDVEKIVLEV